MAKATIVELVDDLDGSTANETVPFAVDGVSFEIDLSSGNADRFRQALQPFVDAGTRVTPDGRRHTRTVISAEGASRREETRAIRAWAHRYGGQLGLAPVGDRGAIPQAVRDAYEKHDGHAPRTPLASPFLAPTDQ
ncbi:Lsr2 family protein [Asanoa sp. NPDC050611]|uniref:histone-like nucleoid-structuring protein Lsr2 n=1 Tax=Asanoa sp. NPDC050611 TaxID=3157098 RepID=UPI0033E52AC3